MRASSTAALGRSSAIRGRLGEVAGAALGLLIVSCALFYAFSYPLTPGRMSKDTAELIGQLGLWSSLAGVPHPESRLAVELAVVLAALVFFAAYCTGVWLAWSRAPGRYRVGAVVCVGIACCAASALAFPTANTDIFSYIASARVATEHGANPYEVTPSAFPGDPVYPYVSDQYARNLPSKLPAWMLLNEAAASVEGDTPVEALLGHRLLLLGFAVGSILLVPAILRRLRPDRLLAGTVAFAWNPVLIVYGPSKTDTVMVFFLLLAVLLLGRRRESLAILALGFSALVKLITLPVIALYLVRQARYRRWLRLLGACGLLVAATAAVYAPFARGPGLLLDHLELLRSVESADGVNRAGGSTLEHATRLLLGGGLLVLTAWLGWVGRTGLPRLVRDWALVALYFALFLTTTALPWYQLVPIALASLTGRAAILGVAIALAGSSFLLGTWQSASSSTFRFDDLLGAPPIVVYLAPAVLAVAALGVAAHRRRAQAGNPRRA